MQYRAFQESDIPQIEELWEHKGFQCNKPDFTKLHGVVLVDGNGVIREAALDRRTSELYFLIDHGSWATPGMKWTHFQRLHEHERKSLAERGYEDVHAFVPPVMKRFAHRLRKFMGWVNSLGPDGRWIGITRDT